MAEKTLAGLKIRAARPDEDARLRGIAVAARSHWGLDLGD
jgi:hypothetical protein